MASHRAIVEISLSASNLPLVGSMRRKTNPIVHMYYKLSGDADYVFVDRTESLKNSQNPSFNAKLLFHVPVSSNVSSGLVKFCIYDVDDMMTNSWCRVTKDDLLCEVSDLPLSILIKAQTYRSTLQFYLTNGPRAQSQQNSRIETQLQNDSTMSSSTQRYSTPSAILRVQTTPAQPNVLTARSLLLSFSLANFVTQLPQPLTILRDQNAVFSSTRTTDNTEETESEAQSQSTFVTEDGFGISLEEGLSVALLDYAPQPSIVTQSDLSLLSKTTPSRESGGGNGSNTYRILCVSPPIANARGELLHSKKAPSFVADKVKENLESYTSFLDDNDELREALAASPDTFRDLCNFREWCVPPLLRVPIPPRFSESDFSTPLSTSGSWNVRLCLVPSSLPITATSLVSERVFDQCVLAETIVDLGLLIHESWPTIPPTDTNTNAFSSSLGMNMTQNDIIPLQEVSLALSLQPPSMGFAGNELLYKSSAEPSSFSSSSMSQSLISFPTLSLPVRECLASWFGLPNPNQCRKHKKTDTGKDENAFGHVSGRLTTRLSGRGASCSPSIIITAALEPRVVSDVVRESIDILLRADNDMTLIQGPEDNVFDISSTLISTSMSLDGGALRIDHNHKKPQEALNQYNSTNTIISTLGLGSVGFGMDLSQSQSMLYDPFASLGIKTFTQINQNQSKLHTSTSMGSLPLNGNNSKHTCPTTSISGYTSRQLSGVISALHAPTLFALETERRRRWSHWQAQARASAATWSPCPPMVSGTSARLLDSRIWPPQVLYPRDAVEEVLRLLPPEPSATRIFLSGYTALSPKSVESMKDDADVERCPRKVTKKTKYHTINQEDVDEKENEQDEETESELSDLNDVDGDSNSNSSRAIHPSTVFSSTTKAKYEIKNKTKQTRKKNVEISSHSLSFNMPDISSTFRRGYPTETSFLHFGSGNFPFPSPLNTTSSPWPASGNLPCSYTSSSLDAPFSSAPYSQWLELQLDVIQQNRSRAYERYRNRQHTRLSHREKEGIENEVDKEGEENRGVDGVDVNMDMEMEMEERYTAPLPGVARARALAEGLDTLRLALESGEPIPVATAASRLSESMEDPSLSLSFSLSLSLSQTSSSGIRGSQDNIAELSLNSWSRASAEILRVLEDTSYELLENAKNAVDITPRLLASCLTFLRHLGLSKERKESNTKTLEIQTGAIFNDPILWNILACLSEAERLGVSNSSQIRAIWRTVRDAVEISLFAEQKIMAEKEAKSQPKSVIYESNLERARKATQNNIFAPRPEGKPLELAQTFPVETDISTRENESSLHFFPPALFRANDGNASYALSLSGLFWICMTIFMGYLTKSAYSLSLLNIAIPSASTPPGIILPVDANPLSARFGGPLLLSGWAAPFIVFLISSISCVLYFAHVFTGTGEGNIRLQSVVNEISDIRNATTLTLTSSSTFTRRSHSQEDYILPPLSLAQVIFWKLIRSVEAITTPFLLLAFAAVARRFDLRRLAVSVLPYQWIALVCVAFGTAGVIQAAFASTTRRPTYSLERSAHGQFSRDRILERSSWAFAGELIGMGIGALVALQAYFSQPSRATCSSLIFLILSFTGAACFGGKYPKVHAFARIFAMSAVLVLEYDLHRTVSLAY